jgi:arylsulfatase A-like enzyme
MKRRSFIKQVGLAAAGTAGATTFPNFLSAAPSAKGSKKPNILIIIVDQLRFPQGSFNQSLLDAAAPNLAALRQQSVSFDAHFAAATACSPSRSTMLTGLYTHQNGMFLTNAQGLAGQAPTPSLSPGFPTWGSILSSAQFGYQTFW